MDDRDCELVGELGIVRDRYRLDLVLKIRGRGTVNVNEELPICLECGYGEDGLEVEGEREGRRVVSTLEGY
jgi:hypothetical protein